MDTGKLLLVIGAISAFALPDSAHAAPLEFDCDVPADRFSLVSNGASEEFSVRGSIEMRELRRGENFSVAGARIIDSAQSVSFGFQLIASDRRSNRFDVVLNIRRNGRLEQFALGQVGAIGPIPFSLSLGNQGQARLTVESIIQNFQFSPISSGTEELFCSTGQFKFSQITYGD